MRRSSSRYVVIAVVLLLLCNYNATGQYRRVEIALTPNTAPVSYQDSVDNDLCDLGELA